MHEEADPHRGRARGAVHEEEEEKEDRGGLEAPESLRKAHPSRLLSASQSVCGAIFTAPHDGSWMACERVHAHGSLAASPSCRKTPTFKSK